jgi:hypothetical protein
MNSSFKVIGLLASIALVTGCAAEVDTTNAEGNSVTTAEQPLAEGGVRIRTGACNRDGMVIKGGTVYRLGVRVGADVTGISSPERSGVCHNTTVWQAAATYICNENGGGTRNEPIQQFDEYIDNALVSHPGGEGHNGLYFAYVDALGPCDTPSQLDYTLDQIECCMSPATPR